MDFGKLLHTGYFSGFEDDYGFILKSLSCEIRFYKYINSHLKSLLQVISQSIPSYIPNRRVYIVKLM